MWLNLYKLAMPMVERPPKADYTDYGHCARSPWSCPQMPEKEELWFIDQKWQFRTGEPIKTHFQLFENELEDGVAQGRYTLNKKYPHGLATLIMFSEMDELHYPQRFQLRLQRVTEMLQQRYGRDIDIMRF
jgi:hypothetical protein